MQCVAPPLPLPPQSGRPPRTPGPGREKALRRYFALIRETMPPEFVPITHRVRKAFQSFHPALPESCRDWDRAKATKAAAVPIVHGPEIWAHTLKKLRDTDPVTAEELEELRQLVGKADIDARVAGVVWSVLKSCVGAWVREEIEVLRLEVDGGT